MQNLEWEFAESGRYEEAEPQARTVLEARRRTLGPEHPDTLESMELLAIALRHLGRAGEAESLQRQELAAKERVLGPRHPETAICRYNLACTLVALGRRDEALASLRAAVEGGLAPRLAAGIAADADLAPLRGDPRFDALVAEGKNAAR
jgi:tetratricopeptide (TPR) repeat protein